MQSMYLMCVGDDKRRGRMGHEQCGEGDERKEANQQRRKKSKSIASNNLITFDGHIIRAMWWQTIDNDGSM